MNSAFAVHVQERQSEIHPGEKVNKNRINTCTCTKNIKYPALHLFTAISFNDFKYILFKQSYFTAVPEYSKLADHFLIASTMP